MQKVALIVNSDKLNLMIAVLNKYNNELNYETDISFKATRSIVHELLCDLSRKSINKSTTQKPFKLSLKYYQAFILRGRLQGFGSDYNQNPIYEKTIANIMVSEINLQL
ncbi:hypothetical protein HX001_17175 [Empedobacter brevis]|uniref:Uncharacterized protein n=1 Tax=Empedobacter brevis TaxID=247 RepID=A0AAJ1QHQ1_9FLAO|nr:hypothetical protein [Empedobacter brevis]MDM1074220.1 hypothetical protein [Empedobacter brevis]